MRVWITSVKIKFGFRVEAVFESWHWRQCSSRGPRGRPCSSRGRRLFGIKRKHVIEIAGLNQSGDIVEPAYPVWPLSGATFWPLDLAGMHKGYLDTETTARRIEYMTRLRDGQSSGTAFRGLAGKSPRRNSQGVSTLSSLVLLANRRLALDVVRYAAGLLHHDRYHLPDK